MFKTIILMTKKWFAIVLQFVPINNSSFTLRWIFRIKISGMSPPFIKAFIIQPEPSFICHSSPSCHRSSSQILSIVWFLTSELLLIFITSPGVAFPCTPKISNMSSFKLLSKFYLLYEMYHHFGSNLFFFIFMAFSTPYTSWHCVPFVTYISVLFVFVFLKPINIGLLTHSRSLVYLLN